MWWSCSTPPYQFDAPTAGQAIADSPFYGQHGYLPDTVDLAKNINMHAMFGIYGPGVAQGKKIDQAALALTSPRPRPTRIGIAAAALRRRARADRGVHRQ